MKYVHVGELAEVHQPLPHMHAFGARIGVGRAAAATTTAQPGVFKGIRERFNRDAGLGGLTMRSSIAYALSISTVAALLAGCRANPGTGIPMTSGSSTTMHAGQSGKTFGYTGKPQVFHVPANVHSITVVMVGASSKYTCPERTAGRPASRS
jgi:hypothetical protein